MDIFAWAKLNKLVWSISFDPTAETAHQFVLQLKDTEIFIGHRKIMRIRGLTIDAVIMGLVVALNNPSCTVLRNTTELDIPKRIHYIGRLPGPDLRDLAMDRYAKRMAKAH